MKFAHFSHVWCKPGMTPHQRYEELWSELQLSDDLGFNYSFCVEHHFRPDESWISSPSLYAVGAGARTKRMRIGPMGYIVPLYHPLRLAEEIAIVDQMLGGRMECGLVPGINADYFRPFGLNYEFRKTPTLEFVDYLRAAYGETQPFSWDGENFHTDDALLSVMPVQKPRPPLWMMSRDPRTPAPRAPMKASCRRRSPARASRSACASTPRSSSAAASRARPRSWPMSSTPTT